LRLAVMTYRVLGSPTTHDTDSNNANGAVSLDIDPGFAIGCGIATVNNTVTWTGLTENYDGPVEGTSVTATAASQNFTSAESGRTISPVGLFGIELEGELHVGELIRFRHL